AYRVVVEGDRLGEGIVVDDHGPADDVGVAADVLGGGVHHDVGAERERLLQVRAGEGVVDHQERVVLVGQFGERGDVGDVEQRVGGRRDPDHARVLAQGLGDARDARDRRGRVVHAPRGGDLVEQAVAAAVGVVGDDDVVAGLEQGPDHGVL